MRVVGWSIVFGSTKHCSLAKCINEAHMVAASLGSTGLYNSHG
jgi:hypothetical protein